MKKLIVAALFLTACPSTKDTCKSLIKKVCKAKMVEEIPPDVVAERGDQMLENCVKYVLRLKALSGVSDEQCVADMTSNLKSYEAL